ncbi:nitroreductase [Sandaracinobacter sp. RS1-74]|uniref:nitroreductase n=1 Tax=Sandaracinobacteroides sayramensis TaxID=2913411 RepID=UPI001EDB6E0A|nr:nitroreductase [Sandaracinobacteroides sayramensis]MCG2840921.1 nitroreductase [Sandaracinobacteroides sayramensis]
MNVSEAVASRRSIRRFLPRPVDRCIIERVLEKARYAPSGGNLQPWNAHVVGDDALARLCDAVARMIPQGRSGHSPEYAIYPPELEGRYAESRQQVGEAMYNALGVPREDKAGRLAQFAHNYHAFGAPLLMLVHTPRYMGPPQWADMGMWLQTVMLLLREEGLDSCAQEAWAVYQQQIRDHVAIPADHILFCGMSIGYRDAAAPVNGFEGMRVPLAACITFAGL